MTKARHLEPHDPVPDSGRYLLVMQRFAEDAPRVVLTELIIGESGYPPQLTIPVDARGTPLTFKDAVAAAEAQADREGFERVYAVDRTMGEREQEILAYDGDHSVHMETLVDENTDTAAPEQEVGRPTRGADNPGR